MGKREYSNYQKKVIDAYYQNLDTIVLNTIAELISELYLADTPAKKNRLWDRAQKAMKKLQVKPELIEHIVKIRDVTILAKNLEEWLRNPVK